MRVLPSSRWALEIVWCYFNLCFYFRLLCVCVCVFLFTNLFSMHLFNSVFIFIMCLSQAAFKVPHLP